MAVSPALWRPQPRFGHAVTSVEEIERLNDAGGIAVSFAPVTTGAVHIAFEGTQSKTLSVWSTDTLSGFRTTPKMTSDLVTIRFIDRGFMLRHDRVGNDVAIGFDQALVTTFDAMLHEQASPGFSSITAAVSREAVVSACQALGGSASADVPRFRSIVEPHGVGMKALRQTMSLLCHQPPGPDDGIDLMTPLLQDLLIYQLISTWPATGWSPDVRMESTDRPVRRAIDYIEGNLRRRLDIAEIAHAAGIGVRALQLSFKQRLGCSPVQYLIARRLDRVHAALSSAQGTSIRQVATEWGFVHMSDFNRRYRERFGRTPGDVLVRHGE